MCVCVCVCVCVCMRIFVYCVLFLRNFDGMELYWSQHLKPKTSILTCDFPNKNKQLENNTMQNEQLWDRYSYCILKTDIIY